MPCKTENWGIGVKLLLVAADIVGDIGQVYRAECHATLRCIEQYISQAMS